MTEQTAPPTAPAVPVGNPAILTAFRWLTIITSLLVLVQAVLATQGLWGGNRGLITGHEHLGNGFFMLIALQVALAFFTNVRGLTSRLNLALSALLVVLVMAQIGIGYASRGTSELVGWHISNGVLLMALTTLNAALAWMPRALTSNKDNS